MVVSDRVGVVEEGRRGKECEEKIVGEIVGRFVMGIGGNVRMIESGERWVRVGGVGGVLYVGVRVWE